jgi:hypothetical protein
MSLSPDEIHMLHGDAVRECLMTLEGHDGGFELLAHCPLRIGAPDQQKLFAIGRSTSTSRAQVLVLDPAGNFPQVGQWRAISTEDLRLLQQ